MLRLADLLGPDGAPYSSYARTIVATLCTSQFLANDTTGWEGIIKHATYHRANNVGVDESIMWGEHYFVEALDHLLTRGER
jgi:unsaturated chondroitin disaccharide hydrolase